ncbi:MAG: universal stress protein [Dehalococcoidia bacterium]
MHERIIVPLDGSKVGESALPHVEDLVAKLSPEVETEVILLQVLSHVSPAVAGGGEATIPDTAYTDRQMEENKKNALDYLNKAGETLRGKGVTVTARVAFGDPSEEIVKAAEEIDVDLIAMSTHGRSGLSRWAFGSVTDKVLRRGGRVPIAMVKATQES